ncbi:MAG: hypothetical protein N2Z70_03175 [Bdellovibrionaceae bacterium]|jgi:hypothetical protein|nr:hypothetical protein [Pseudobdellovibrionaceae bacterium]
MKSLAQALNTKTETKQNIINLSFMGKILTKAVQAPKLFLMSQLALTFLLSACGANKQSRSSESHMQSPVGLSSQAQGVCSIDQSRHPDLGMKLMAHRHPQTGWDARWIRVKMIRLTQSFSQSPDSAIQFWTRTISHNGTWGGFTNMRFYISYQNRTTPYSYQDLTWKDMQNLAQWFGFQASTAAEFFSRVEFLIYLPSPEHKTLTLSTYLGGSQQAQASVTALVPIFDANPDTYAAQKPAALAQLHPLKHLSGQGFNTAALEQEIQRYCF